METHSSILIWRIPWTEKPSGLQSVGSKESDSIYRLNYYQVVAGLVAKLCPTLANLWTVACHAFLSMRLLQVGILKWVAHVPSKPKFLHPTRVQLC